MVKAVNKLIMEINNTENECFEKAIFYIRPDMAGNVKLNKSAESFLSQMGNTFRKKEPARSHGVLIGIISALTGSAVTAVILLFILI